MWRVDYVCFSLHRDLPYLPDVEKVRDHINRHKELKHLRMCTLCHVMLHQRNRVDDVPCLTERGWGWVRPPMSIRDWVVDRRQRWRTYLTIYDNPILTIYGRSPYREFNYSYAEQQLALRDDSGNTIYRPSLTIFYDGSPYREVNYSVVAEQQLAIWDVSRRPYTIYYTPSLAIYTPSLTPSDDVHTESDTE